MLFVISTIISTLIGVYISGYFEEEINFDIESGIHLYNFKLGLFHNSTLPYQNVVISVLYDFDDYYISPLISKIDEIDWGSYKRADEPFVDASMYLGYPHGSELMGNPVEGKKRRTSNISTYELYDNCTIFEHVPGVSITWNCGVVNPGDRLYIETVDSKAVPGKINVFVETDGKKWPMIFVFDPSSGEFNH